MMNTALKLFGLAAVVAVMGLIMAGCKDPGNDPTHEHIWGEWTQTTAPTCTEAGIKTRACTLDSSHIDTETQTGDPAIGHDWHYVEGSGTAPTCTEKGEGKEVCSHDASHERNGELPALGHNFIFEEETKQATCSETGKELWKCTHDDTTEERPVPIDPSAHDWETLAGTAPTCLLPGNGTIKCRLCEEEENGVLNPLGHDNGSWHTHTKATCEVDGKEERRCNRDDFVLETKTIEKLGHDWGDWTLTTPASILAEGEETGTCTNDSTHTATRSIDMLISLIDVAQIPAGTFQMGSPTNEPERYSDETQHSVTLTQGFYMGKYQVTQEQYQAVMGTNPSYFTTGVTAGEVQEKRPVEMVRWYDALVFCNKLSVMEGLTPAYSISGSTDPAAWGTVPTSSNATWNAVIIVVDSNGYRLPTEAQWEYACRAETTTAYNTGATISDDTGWYTSNSNSRTHEVGKKPPNDWGLYDMHGNVAEWCWDWYGTYASGAQTDPTGASSGSYRVSRCNGSAAYVRSAYRDGNVPSGQYANIGFRLLRP